MNESTKNLGEAFKKIDSEDRNTQTPAILNVRGTQLSCDPFSFMKGSEIFFKIVEESSGNVFWNGVYIQALGENGISIRGEQYDITLNIQEKFINTEVTTKNMNKGDKSTVYNILQQKGFYDISHVKKGLKSSRMRAALKYLRVAIEKIRYPLLSLPTMKK